MMEDASTWDAELTETSLGDAWVNELIGVTKSMRGLSKLA